MFKIANTGSSSVWDYGKSSYYDFCLGDWDRSGEKNNCVVDLLHGKFQRTSILCGIRKGRKFSVAKSNLSNGS